MPCCHDRRQDHSPWHGRARLSQPSTQISTTFIQARGWGPCSKRPRPTQGSRLSRATHAVFLQQHIPDQSSAQALPEKSCGKLLLSSLDRILSACVVYFCTKKDTTASALKLYSALSTQHSECTPRLPLPPSSTQPSSAPPSSTTEEADKA